MTTSKEVFAKRRDGALDEAYQLALELMRDAPDDEWNMKAYAWCLVDLIKRDAASGGSQSVDHYGRQLRSIKISAGDEILVKQANYAIALCDPNARLVSDAKALSKSGNHFDSAEIYRKVCASGVVDKSILESFGWELYRISKDLLAQPNPNPNRIKRHLNEYLELRTDRPSLLHSCMLQLAAKLASEKQLSMLAFGKLWDLACLRPEDFERFIGDDGKSYPSLAEKVVLQAGKEAVSAENPAELNYVLPHIDVLVERFSDNLWLSLAKAKVLLALGRNDEAQAFGVAVTKSKLAEYWAWELLGDICGRSSVEAMLGCYCKALLCDSDDKFTGKVRLKFAQCLIEAGKLANAKYEVERVVAQRNNAGQRIPDTALSIISQPWYAETSAADSNHAFYRQNVHVAEALLFSELPWISASVGEPFVVPGKERKPKRKLFVASADGPFEVAVPESKFKFSELAPGDGVRIKGEVGRDNKYHVYTVEKRATEMRWDVFPEQVGVVDHVNREKQLIHFIVARGVDGIVSFSDLSGPFQEGDAIAVRLSRYSNKQGVRYRVVDVRATNEEPSTAVRKSFREVVRAENGMGFTANDIFIPPPLMRAHRIEDDSTISGVALLSYNKKRSTWGWKAVSVDEVISGRAAAAVTS